MSLDPRPILDAPVERGVTAPYCAARVAPCSAPVPRAPPVARRNQKANSSPGWGRRRAPRLSMTSLDGPLCEWRPPPTSGRPAAEQDATRLKLVVSTQQEGFSQPFHFLGIVGCGACVSGHLPQGTYSQEKPSVMAMTSVGTSHTCAGIPLLLSATRRRSGCCRVTPRPPSLYSAAPPQPLPSGPDCLHSPQARGEHWWGRHGP